MVRVGASFRTGLFVLLAAVGVGCGEDTVGPPHLVGGYVVYLTADHWMTSAPAHERRPRPPRARWRVDIEFQPTGAFSYRWEPIPPQRGDAGDVHGTFKLGALPANEDSPRRAWTLQIDGKPAGKVTCTALEQWFVPVLELPRGHLATSVWLMRDPPN